MNTKLLLIDIPVISGSDQIRIYPPHWAAYLSAYLECRVEYLDARVEHGSVLLEHHVKDASWFSFGLPLSELVERIRLRSPEILGIHVGVSAELGVAERLVDLLSREKMALRIILGGPGIATVPRKYLPPSLRKCEISTALSFGSPMNVSLPWRSYSIDTLPDREIFSGYSERYREIGRFHSGRPIVEPAGQITTSVGCGGTCLFCPSRNMIRRERSGSSVMKEMLALRCSGVRCLQLEDDNFLGWAEADVRSKVSLLGQIIDLGFEGVEFPNGLTVRSMRNPLFLGWLEEALRGGTYVRIGLPFESASDESLRLIRKPHRHDECLELLRKFGAYKEGRLQLEAFLQIGIAAFDTSGVLVLEKESSIRETIRFAKELKEAGIVVNVFFNSPVPGSELFPFWREKYPDEPWERLLYTVPPAYLDGILAQELRAEMREINDHSQRI
ncbi:MAG: hypothetical protein HGB18_04555 [Candidatus Moranbacteria bacterium]|nr:hypothetical protein [Candidatus Moranbacteria bacterium]